MLLSDGLHRHLEDQRVEYLQFSFRWMNNLLMREIPLRCVVRLWDTYLVSTTYLMSGYLVGTYIPGDYIPDE